MAVSINHTMVLPSGVTVTYWRAVNVSLNLTNGVADVTLAAWLNDTSYSNGLGPVTSRTVSVTLPQDTRAALDTSLASLLPQALGS